MRGLATRWPAAIVSLCVAAAGCSAGGTPIATTRAEASEGPYRLAFEVPRSDWKTEDSITGQATLSVTGSSGVDLRGSGSGLIAFEFTEVGGSRDMGPERTLDCAPYRLDPDHAITSAITKSGGYSETGPDADFLRSFFAGDEVHLSPGNWTIAAIAMFSATGCATDHTLRATVLVHVTS